MKNFNLFKSLYLIVNFEETFVKKVGNFLYWIESNEFLKSTDSEQGVNFLVELCLGSFLKEKTAPFCSWHQNSPFTQTWVNQSKALKMATISRENSISSSVKGLVQLEISQSSI